MAATRMVVMVVAHDLGQCPSTQDDDDDDDDDDWFDGLTALNVLGLVGV